MGEDVLHAAGREAAEEVGVLIDPADLEHVHTVHVAGSGPDSRIGLFFTARQWIGEPTNREPDKCWSLGWFALDALPRDMVPYPAAGIEAYRTAPGSAGLHPHRARRSRRAVPRQICGTISAASSAVGSSNLE
ncbi:NUDIX domain-containing protein [Saccharopolyspora hattusasensis]|uniref:NUDIX domain-containing protein n=1 Tax=Saccharopolyspora hattusasensis TaxID=1128679 RepID=UPI003D96681B